MSDRPPFKTYFQGDCEDPDRCVGRREPQGSAKWHRSVTDTYDEIIMNSRSIFHFSAISLSHPLHQRAISLPVTFRIYVGHLLGPRRQAARPDCGL